MSARRRWIAALAALALGLQALLAPAQVLAAIGLIGLDPDGICYAPGDRAPAPVPAPARTGHLHHCILCPALDGPTAVLPSDGEPPVPLAGTANIVGPADTAFVVAAGFRPPSRAPPQA